MRTGRIFAPGFQAEEKGPHDGGLGEGGMKDISDTEFGLLKVYLSNICGIEIPPEKRYLFRTRLGEFFADERCSNFSQLYNRLCHDNDPGLTRRLVQAMTIHETSFFRDRHPFELLRQRLLPDIANRRLTEGGARGAPRLRILSSGCSSGQEPYSIAMCVDDWLITQNSVGTEHVTILGFDISRRILAQAERGVYSPKEMGMHIPTHYRSRYLTCNGGKWEVNGEIRQMVTFAEMNLAGRFGYLGKFDVIFCRNVLIYFSRDLARRILVQFRNMLMPGGAVVLGVSESLYRVSDEFAPVHVGPSTYYVLRDEVA